MARLGLSELESLAIRQDFDMLEVTRYRLRNSFRLDRYRSVVKCALHLSAYKERLSVSLATWSIGMGLVWLTNVGTHRRAPLKPRKTVVDGEGVCVRWIIASASGSPVYYQ